MSRTILVGLFLTVCVGTGDTAVTWKPSPEVVIEAEPDTRQARELDRWPNANDMTRLQSVEGKPKAAVILQVLGHPSHVERRPDGVVIWEYPWCAVCQVRIRNGICIGTYYTAGW